MAKNLSIEPRASVHGVADTNSKLSSPSILYPTPEYFHCLTDSRFIGHVYEPEADSFLFLRALELERETLLHSSFTKKPIERCVEVGCGSGIVITHLHTLLCSASASSASSSSLVSVGVERGSRTENAASSSGNQHVDKEVSRDEKLSLAPNLLPTTSRYSSFSPPPSSFQRNPNCYPFLSAISSPITFVAVDVNPTALEATAVTWCETGQKYFDSSHRFSVDYSHTSLKNLEEKLPFNSSSVFTTTNALDSSSSLLHLVEGDLQLEVNIGFETLENQGTKSSSYDIILFNPPYIPTSQEELNSAVSKNDSIARTYCGGPRGRVVLDRFLRILPTYLACPGRCYIVLIRENDVEDVKRFILEEVFVELPSEFHRKTGLQSICTADATKASTHDNDVEQAEAHENVVNEVQQTQDTPNKSKKILAEESIEFYEVLTRYTGEHLGVYCILRTPISADNAK